MTIYYILCPSVIAILIIVRLLIWRRDMLRKAKSKKQFEVDLEAFKATGLSEESIFDIEINEDLKEEIRKKILEKNKKADQQREKRVYIIECVNANRCAVCGGDTKEVRYPVKPGCWGFIKICTKCTWQVVLSDL